MIRFKFDPNAKFYGQTISILPKPEILWPSQVSNPTLKTGGFIGFSKRKKNQK